MESVIASNEEKQQEMKIYKTIYDLLSIEKITFNGKNVFAIKVTN